MSFDPKDEFGAFSPTEGDDGGMIEAAEGFDLTGDGSKRRKWRDSTIALAIILLVAGGVLYGMKQLATKSVPATSDASIETQIEDALQTMFAGGSTSGAMSAGRESGAPVALSSLTLDRTDSQVPLDMVKKNPFIMWSDRPATDEPIDDATLERRRLEDLARREAEHRLELQGEVARMSLTSVMGRGDNAVAVIDDQVVQCGDVLDGMFEIVRIEPLKVTLSGGGYEFELKLKF